MEANAGLAIYFSSNDLALTGTRLRVRLGLSNQETTLRQISDTEIAAKLVVPWQQRRGDMTELSVELL